MTARTRSRLVLAAKTLVAAALITYLVRSGSLDFSKLRLLFDRPLLMAVNVGLFLFGAFCGAMRYRFLLRLADTELSVPRAMQLQLTALFFNVVIPGSVGGDVIKALYVSRDASPTRRTTILLIIFVDRLVGLAALVLVASFIALLRGPMIWSTPELRNLTLAVGFLGVCTLIGPALFVLILRRAGERIERWISGPSRIAKLAGQLVAAARLLAAGPGNLVKALTISMGMHTAAMTYFMLLARAVTGQEVPFGAIATVFPLGMLTMMVPIAPAGLGVGHVAFDRLFAMLGLSGGADVFNIYLISQVSLCLTGVVPYLALKRKGELPTEAPTEAAETKEAKE